MPKVWKELDIFLASCLKVEPNVKSKPSVAMITWNRSVSCWHIILVSMLLCSNICYHHEGRHCFIYSCSSCSILRQNFNRPNDVLSSKKHFFFSSDIQTVYSINTLCFLANTQAGVSGVFLYIHVSIYKKHLRWPCPMASNMAMPFSLWFSSFWTYGD